MMRLIIVLLFFLAIPAAIYWLIKWLLPWLDRLDQATCEEKKAAPSDLIIESAPREPEPVQDYSSLEAAFQEEFEGIPYEEKDDHSTRRRFCFGNDKEWGALEAYLSCDEIFVSIGNLTHEHFDAKLEQDIWDSKAPNHSAARKASKFISDILEQRIIFAIKRKGTQVLSVSYSALRPQMDRSGKVIPLTGGCLTALFSSSPCVIEERCWEPLREKVVVTTNPTQSA